MFRFGRNLRALKAEDKKRRREYQLDEEDNLIIDVKLDGCGDAYQRFSSQHDLRLDPDLKEYLYGENYKITNPVVLRFYNDILMENETEQKKLEAIYRNEMARERHSDYLKIKLNNLKGFIFLIIGLLVLAANTLLAAFEVSLIFYTIDIVAWVFLWEMTDLLFLERPVLNARYWHLTKLSEAKVEFYPGEPLLSPCLPEQSNQQEDGVAKERGERGVSG